ncbi:MAG: hypothetical protein NVSMB45_12910 [Ginsengibacter sp.]
MSTLIDIFLALFIYGILLYSVLLITSYMMIGLFAIKETDSYLHKNDFTDYRLLASSSHAPHVTIIAPAYNEGMTIVENVRSLLSIQYTNLELIIINDGSKDDSLSKLIAAYQLMKVNYFIDNRLPTKPVRGVYRSRNPRFKRLLIIDKENGGKGDTLNVGINASSNNYVVCIDADCVLEQDSVLKMIKPFLEETDEQVIASGGVIRIANSCVIEDGRIKEIRMPKEYLPRIQSLEYIRAFLLGRMAWSRLNGLMIISGAFGMFRKDIAIECGGYDHKTVGEDMELVVRMRRLLEEKKKKYRIMYIPDPLCWTEAPFSFKILGRQRNRWTRGLYETLKIHKKMFLNPDYHLLGALSYPYWFFFEMLGPLVEFLGFIVFIVLAIAGLIDWDFFFIFLAFIVCFGQTYSIFAIYMEVATYYQYKRKRDILNLIFTAISEPFYFHPFIVYSALKGYIDLIKKKSSWGEMTRQGFGTAQTNTFTNEEENYLNDDGELVVDHTQQQYLAPIIEYSAAPFGSVVDAEASHIEQSRRSWIMGLLLKMAESAQEFMPGFIILAALIFLETTFELCKNFYLHGAPKFFGSVIATSFLKDLGFLFEIGFILFIIYFIISFFSKKAASVIFIILGALIVIIQLSLSEYFLTALVPLGGDLWSYSIADIKQTVGASGGVPFSLIFIVMLLAICMFTAFKYLKPRLRIPASIAAVIVSFFIIALFINTASYTNKFQPGQEFSNNLSTNKSWFFISSSWDHFFPEIKRNNDFYAVSSKSILDSGKSNSFQNFSYPDETNFPFFHYVDTSRDVLSSFFDSNKTKPNIVLILVEGLGRAFTNKGALLGNYTPFLDSLSNHSLYWDNFLSEGGRTFAVLPSILGSLPFNKNGFNELAEQMPPHYSLLNIMKNNGYNTSFYYGGDAHFDFMDTYLRKNNIDAVNDIKTFPGSYHKMPASSSGFSWGYGDKELFRRFLETKQNVTAPFFSVILTVSTHSPFLINDQAAYFKKFEQRLVDLRLDETQKTEARNYKNQYASILFMNDAIAEFITNYKKRPDFNNTVFLITGDHRMPEIPMSTKIDRYHVPFIIYSPRLKRAQTFSSVSTHFDITPSIVNWMRHSFGFNIPLMTSWMGQGLDTEHVFRNIHAYPLMQTKNIISDFIKGNYMLNDNTLFEIHNDMSLNEIIDENKKLELIAAFDRFKIKNDKFIVTKTLLPDSLLNKISIK